MKITNTMKHLLTLRNALLALILAIGLAACDSSTPAADDSATDGVAQLSVILASELGLSADQYDLVEAAAERHGEGDARDPAYLWYLAKELSQTLTPEQKEALLARAAAMADRFAERGLDGPFGRPGAGNGGGSGMGPGGMGAGGMGAGGMGAGGQGPGGPNGLEQAGAGPHDGIGSILTDEQKKALHELHKSFADRRRAAADAIRDAVDADGRASAIEAMRLLNDEIRAAIDAWLDSSLSDEQKALREAQRAEREAAREAGREAVRDAILEVLGLVSADELEAIHDAFVTAVEAARAGRDAGGSNDEFRAAVQAAADARDASIQDLLSDEAYEIFLIHRALAMRASHMPQGPRGPGGSGQAGGHGAGGHGPGGPGGQGQGGPGGGSQG